MDTNTDNYAKLLNDHITRTNASCMYRYEDVEVEHDVYQLGFVCIATYTIDNINQLFKSDVMFNKKDAKKNVCEKIYNIMVDIDDHNTNTCEVNTIEIDEMFEIITQKPALILVDYENVSSKNDKSVLDKLEQNEMISVIRFASYGSSVNPDIIVESMHRDAVDHYITFYLGNLIGKNRHILDETNIYILTRDSFGACLHDFDSRIVHVPTTKYLLENLKIK